MNTYPTLAEATMQAATQTNAIIWHECDRYGLTWRETWASFTKALPNWLDDSITIYIDVNEHGEIIQ